MFNTPDNVWGMKLLKDLKIDVNMRNKDRSSPLHVAAFFGKPACVYGLIPRQSVGNLEGGGQIGKFSIYLGKNAKNAIFE